MLEIKNVVVYDLCESIVAAGYAMLTEYDDDQAAKDAFELQKIIIDGKLADGFKENKHLKRALRLVKSSKNSDIKCHDNFLTGIRVSFDLKYPSYITPELQRYHWIDIVTSMSKMHRIIKMDFDKCCNKYVTEETKENMKKYIAEYNDLSSDGKTPSGDDLYEAFMKIISNCPHGVELVMRVSTNYKQLQTIYSQRKDHRLKEDWGAFCSFIKRLPLADQLILGKEVGDAE